jgi:Rps23 Pro-64 3,4-dihydroxylase Tpa1-like proline 4-hydroxylase
LIKWNQITQHKLETDPYRWAMIGDLYSPEDAAALAQTYPRDHFKLLSNRGGEKDYEYEARSLVGMGAQTPSYPEKLSPAWRALAEDLVSPAYRNAMSLLTGCDLTDSPLEVNVFHYGPGCSLGPHPDLSDKVVTHVLYFNEAWNRGDGGCLGILRSADAADLAAEVPPLVGNSAVIVRSENSWHQVSPVVRHSRTSRRSVTVTFYRPGSVSSMWPVGDPTPLHDYQEAVSEAETGAPGAKPRWWSRLVAWGR